MPKIVRGPDGTEYEFPDEVSEQQIAAVVGVPQASSRDQRPSAGWRLVQSVGSALNPVEVGKGIVKGAGRTAVDLGALVQQIPGVSQGVDWLYGTPGLSAQAFPAAREALRAQNLPQQIGGGLETAAELALPIGRVTKTTIAAIPRAGRAAQTFQRVMSAAKDVPIDISEAGNVALRIQQLAERGGTMPTAVRKFLLRATDPAKGDLSYQEARDFASNISRLSSDEFNRLTQVIKDQLIKLRVALNAANLRAASQVGHGADYAAAMKEYVQAKRLEDAWHTIWQGTKRALPYVGAAAVGGQVAKDMLWP